jgi:hypothetical protein
LDELGMITGTKKEECFIWGLNWREKHHVHDLTVLPSAKNAETFHRNICSAVLDANVYPSLDSTPFWLRWIFGVISVILGVRHWLIAKLLWIQIRMIYYSHDFWSYEGQISISWLWDGWYFPALAPQWVRTLEWKSGDIFSRMVLRMCSWIGRYLLGMRGEYDEYTPRQPEPESSGHEE